MKTSKVIFDDFVAWRFEMSAGDRKKFNKSELVRGLDPITEHTWPLNCISVYVRGKFKVYSDGKYIGIRERGSLPLTFSSESWENCYNEAVQDDSLYFCIYPKTREQRYFNREIVHAHPQEINDDTVYYFAMHDDGNIELFEVGPGRSLPVDIWESRKECVWCKAF